MNDYRTHVIGDTEPPGGGPRIDYSELQPGEWFRSRVALRQKLDRGHIFGSDNYRGDLCGSAACERVPASIVLHSPPGVLVQRTEGGFLLAGRHWSPKQLEQIVRQGAALLAEGVE